MIHVYETAKLGKAPFKHMGVYSIPSSSLAEHNVDAYNYALKMMPKGYHCGICAFCGMPLTHNHLIKSSDGNTFSVGSECVTKSGDSGLMTAAEYARKEVARKKRNQEKAKREKEREIRYQAKLQEQRERNGGLTDYEIEKKNQQDRKEKYRLMILPAIDILKPYAERMADGKGRFRDSIAETLKEGKLPYGNGFHITCDILAKQAGRSNSKAYKAEWSKISEDFARVENIRNEAKALFN